MVRIHAGQPIMKVIFLQEVDSRKTGGDVNTMGA